MKRKIKNFLRRIPGILKPFGLGLGIGLVIGLTFCWPFHSYFVTGTGIIWLIGATVTCWERRGCSINSSSFPYVFMPMVSFVIALALLIHGIRG